MPQQILKTIQLRLKNTHFSTIRHISFLHLSHKQSLYSKHILPDEEVTIEIPIYSLGAIDLLPKNLIDMEIQYSYGHLKNFKIQFPEEAKVIAIEWNQNDDLYEGKMLK